MKQVFPEPANCDQGSLSFMYKYNYKCVYARYNLPRMSSIFTFTAISSSKYLNSNDSVAVFKVNLHPWSELSISGGYQLITRKSVNPIHCSVGKVPRKLARHADWLICTDGHHDYWYEVEEVYVS